jgi:putative effector of murein hydrolase
LALPIYNNRQVFLKNLLPAGCGLLAGSLGTMIVAGLLAREFRFSQNLVASISIKSATTPIAVEIAKVVQGAPALTAIFVVATGVIGAALGPWLMDRIGITHPVARGLALGTISHGIGTAQAVSESELAGAAAGVAMGLGAVCTALAAPYVVPLLAR